MNENFLNKLHVLYTELFSPSVIFSHLHLQTVRPTQK